MTLTACAGALSLIGVSTASEGCKGASSPPGQLIEAGEPIAASGCVLLEAIDSSGVLQTICSDLPLVLEVAALVVPLFAASKGESCTLSAATGQCYTNTQRLNMIIKLRAKDAGR